MRERKQTRKRKEHESRDGRTVKKKKKRDKEHQRESGIRQERSRALCGKMAAMRNRKGKRDQLEEEVRGVRCVDEWRCGARRAKSQEKREEEDEENEESQEKREEETGGNEGV